MHAQLVWKPGTVKICYHGLSAHKEQFAITTDGKNGHCPIAWTEGQPDDAQTSHRKKPFHADFPYFLLFARWGGNDGVSKGIPTLQAVKPLGYWQGP